MRRKPGAPADLEEVRPGLFFVYNPAAGPALRGEGEREGDRFRLTSWRREGLIGRLRGKGFSVLTLADQIAALPQLPAATPPGPAAVRPLAAGERISYFGLPAQVGPPDWQPAPNDAPGTVALHEGWSIRRRKGRGPGSYFLVARNNLRPLDEDSAIAYGLAQIALSGPTPVAVAPAEGGYLLAELPMPRPYRALLPRLAEKTRGGWLVAPEAMPLAEALLARLGLALRYNKEGPGIMPGPPPEDSRER